MSRPTRRRRRRSRDEWAAVLERFQRSDVDGPTFCAREGLGYASFCAWRRRLAAEPRAPTVTSPPSIIPETAFIDLGPMGSPTEGGWAVELELGGGVVLRVKRG